MAQIKELNLADKEKLKLTLRQQKQIKKLYSDLSKKAAKEAAKLPSDQLVSEAMRKSYLNAFVKRLNAEVDNLTRILEKTIPEETLEASKLPVTALNEFMTSAGLSLKGALSYVPTDVVERLLAGKVYEGNWNFSSALWQAGEKTKSDMYSVVAKGIADNKPTLEIAKDLEKYLNPSARKEWDWSKVYPGTNKKVDYSAQRLARTLSQHAYQLSLKQSVKHNPFVEEITWHSAFAHGRTCQICKDRDGVGYQKDKLPLDHPSGLCYFTVDVGSMDEVSNRIANWYNGKPDVGIDDYVKAATKRR